MTQIQLKIEDFLGDKTIIELSGEQLFKQEILTVINPKWIDDIKKQPFLDSVYYFYYRKQNETRETIIQSLWEYQKSLCWNRKDDELYAFDNDEMSYRFNNGEYQSLYNYKSRIITITKFED